MTKIDMYSMQVQRILKLNENTEYNPYTWSRLMAIKRGIINKLHIIQMIQYNELKSRGVI